MIQLTQNRAHISLATALTFIPTMITSLLLLFHLHFPGIIVVHKWVGLAFVLSCLLHIPINWNVLRKYFNDRSAILAVAFTGLLTLSLVVLGAVSDNGEHGHHGKGRSNYITIK